MRTFEYRLYPTRIQRERLLACLRDSRALYNEMLEVEQTAHRECGRFLTKYDLTARFKSANQWHSIHLRQRGKDFRFTEDGKRLWVPAKLGGPVKIKVHRPIEGLPKTCHLVLRADGHWYALIVCELPAAEAVSVPDNRSAVGLDMGITHFLTDSDGNTVANPRCYQASLKTLRRKQRSLSRRTTGSHRRTKAARDVAKTHLKVERQRTDFHRKVAKQYADLYSAIAVEDLNVRGLARDRLARQIHDVGWSAFLTILTCKAESAGGHVIRVPARFTSQRCSRCGAMVEKSLSVRTHSCPSCGLIADRDLNAARNILQQARAGAPPSGTVEIGPPVEPRSRRL